VNRVELERLDRDALIARAEGAGVARARILTRPELVDELLLRSAVDDATKERARGLFGRARDLLARLVERGLNRPETADRIRAVGRAVGRVSAPAALPTLTLAEIYVAQGYRERAIETLERVISAEPEHATARALLARLRDAAFAVPSPQMPPETEPDDSPDPAVIATAQAAASPPAPPAPAAEPSHMLDDAPLPPRYDVNECVALAVDPRTVYVYWEVRERTIEDLRPGSVERAIVIRVVAVEPAWSGPNSTIRDIEVRATLGELFVHDLAGGAVVRAAVGVRRGAEFVPIVHSAALEMPPSSAAPLSGTKLARWTPEGAEPLARGEADGAALTGVVARIRKDYASTWRTIQPVRGPPEVGALGASEQFAGEAPSPA
jgi:hypothetical protein